MQGSEHNDLFNEDESTQIGNISIVNKLILDLDGKKAWFFHGDVFDISIQNAKWLAKLGCYGYDFLIVLNSLVNWCLEQLGKERYSLSKKIKDSVKGANKYVNDFEKVATDLAIENGYDYVVCGHIHQPKMIVKENKNGKTTYLNSGDWVENFTALEYQFKRWKLYKYNSDKRSPYTANDDVKEMKIQDLIAAITIVDQPKKKKKQKKP